MEQLIRDLCSVEFRSKSKTKRLIEDYTKKVIEETNSVLGETKINPVGRDAICCQWFECDSCKETTITDSFKYCPNCGKKIIK